MISARHDYSSEIIALIVLIILSALSHFWYVLIAIGIGAALMGMCFFFARIILRATMVSQTKGTP
jgi:energy-coupling factor transporter transmembrane protein EcfT